MLDIILRTSYQKGVANLPRINNVDRKELILKSFVSLVTSIRNCNRPTKLHILDDHSGDEFLDRVKRILESYKISDYELVSLTNTGPNFSALEQFRWGKDYSKELVYFVEDDYLHAPDAIESMLSANEQFQRLSGLNPIAIYPFDSVGMYLPDRMAPTRLFYYENRLWRGTKCSSNTMLIHSGLVRQYWRIFEHLAVNFGKDTTVTEDTTINRLWNNTVDVGGPICLFSPIPSLAIHVAYHEPLLLKTNLNDWKSDYAAIVIPE